MTGPVTLQRQHFGVSLAAAYFTLTDLQAQTGQEPNQWRHVILKELTDNALDAAEASGNAPDIQIEFTETANGLKLAISDNGPGIPPHIVGKLLDFGTFFSDKAAYRAPLRGQQGNAWKTVLGIPIALGNERSRVIIEAANIYHDIQIWISPSSEVRRQHQPTPALTETHGTRITIIIPGPAACYRWDPTRWATAYGLFNPHARLQIREIDHKAWPESKNNRPQPATEAVSDLSLLPTVSFPADRWRKFLPTDPTPAHWYTAQEFARLVHLKAEHGHAEQPLGDFIQEFKGLSRVWRKVRQALSVETLAQLADEPLAIPTLHTAMCAHTPAPKPEILGRVGPDHFRHRFDKSFKIVSNRFWYKHQWASVDGMPYLIEAALAETEESGGVFYGLNYGVPFTDPLSTTRLAYNGGPENLEAYGLSAFLYEAGALSGSRFGKTIRTTAAIHLVMPLLPSLDRGKSRLAVPSALAAAIADTVGHTTQVLHKEIVDWRKHQAKRERQAQQEAVRVITEQGKERERQTRLMEAQREREEREQQREHRRAERAREQKRRQERGELPTKREVLFDLFLPTYRVSTENEAIRISQRDFFYDVRPHYNRIAVRPSKNSDGTENTELDFSHFARTLADFRKEIHPLPMIDYKARGTLFESHSGREIPIGDRELRDYRFPRHEYAGILFIEKEGIWQTLKDTGGIELMRRYDLMVAAAEGYSNEAARKLLALAQNEHGYQILVWHDADPYGYNIARTLAEPTERMPDHHLDVIDIGLRLAEGLEMGLQTETFTRKKALPEGIFPMLTDKELELFTGEQWRVQRNPDRFEWRNCQRIEINAIKARDRAGYLAQKIGEALQRRSAITTTADSQQPPIRPSLEDMVEMAQSLVERDIRERARAALSKRIRPQEIEAAALAALPYHDLTEALKSALDTDLQSHWREIVKRTAAKRLVEDDGLPDTIKRVVDAAIRQAMLEAAL
jgi:hypothetical protein